MEPSQMASSSSQPVPHLPLSLAVAQRDSLNRLLPKKSDVQSLTDSDKLKAARLRQTERWVDMLMETRGVELKRFKRSSIFLQPTHYESVTHERHLTDLCSYPPCANSPLRPFSSKPRYKVISTLTTSNLRSKKQDLVKIEGNYDDGFCSMECLARSKWFLGGLKDEPVWVREFEGKDEKEKRKWMIRDLLEDLEKRGEWTFTRAHDERRSNGTGSGHSAESRKEEKTSEALSNPRKILGYDIQDEPTVQMRPGAHITDIPVEELAALQKTIEAAPPAMKPIDQTQSSSLAPSLAVNSQDLNKLIENLKIVERPTPSTPPTAPSLNPISPISELPATRTESTPNKSSTNPPSSSSSQSPSPIQTVKSRESGRRAYLSSSALAPISSDLSQEVMAASREGAEGFVVSQHIAGALGGNRSSPAGMSNGPATSNGRAREIWEDEEEEEETEEMRWAFEEMMKAREELKGQQEA